MDKDQVGNLINSLPSPGWRHRIDVGHGLVTPGREDSNNDLRRLELEEDLTGKRILDIGCSDGFFSFECERRGADVIAIDNFCSTPKYDNLSGFSIAAKLRKSNAKLYDMSVYDIEELGGNFDIILFLNVLYHLRYPVFAIDKIFSSLNMGGKMLMKTYHHQDFRFRNIGFSLKRKPCAMFYEGKELNNDPSNWWGFNRKCIEAMLRSADFSSIKLTGKLGDRLYYSALK